MKDFKNSTKTQYMKGGMCEGYAKGGNVKGAAKISKVMGEFKSGELHSGSKKGPIVKSPKQATAIALSEARKAGAKIPMKKAIGGSAEAGDVLISRMNKNELAAGAKGIKTAKERLERDEVKGVMGREMKIKEAVRKAVPVPRDKPLVPNNYEEKLLKRATRSPSVEAGDTDPRLRGMKHGGKVMKKASGGGIDVSGAVKGAVAAGNAPAPSRYAMPSASAPSTPAVNTASIMPALVKGKPGFKVKARFNEGGMSKKGKC